MNLGELWAWAVLQRAAVENTPPIRLNQENYPDGEAPGKLLTPDINRRGWPFTVPFERYLDGHLDKAPIVRALEEIGTDPSLRLEHEICWAILMGGYDDQDALWAVLGRPSGFQQAAGRGLTLLREKTERYVQKRIAETDERRTSAGEAEQARAEDRNEQRAHR